ncbi:hypothetical protein Bca4012_047073 [Brassica carinata]
MKGSPLTISNLKKFQKIHQRNKFVSRPRDVDHMYHNVASFRKLYVICRILRRKVHLRHHQERRQMGDTVVFWDGFDLPVADSFNPYMVVWNLTKALATTKKLVGFLKLFYFCEDDLIKDDDMREAYDEARFFTETGYRGGYDPLCKYARTKSMIASALLWAGDARTCRVDEPANIVIVSDSVSDQPEFVNLLEALKQRNFNILLVQQHDEEKEKLYGIPTESFDWLWTSLLHGGTSQGVNRSDSSSTCGDGVPLSRKEDFYKEIEALDQAGEALDQDKEALESLTSVEVELYDPSKEVEAKIEALAKALFGAIELKDVEHGTSKAFKALFKKALAEEARVKKARAKKARAKKEAVKSLKEVARAKEIEARKAEARAKKALAKEKLLKILSM